MGSGIIGYYCKDIKIHSVLFQQFCSLEDPVKNRFTAGSMAVHVIGFFCPV